MKLPRILGFVHLGFALWLFAMFALAPWRKESPDDFGAFSSDGGTGYGLIGVILAAALLVLAIMRVMGRRSVLPGLGLGVEQLTLVFALASVANMFAYIVGWLAVFDNEGTGWGLAVGYWPVTTIPQIGLLTISLAEPSTGIRPLQDSERRTFSIVALIAAVGVILFPFLTWLSSGPVSLSAMDGRSGNPTSGPRFGYMLIVLGVVVALGAIMRMRPQGLAEPGPNLLLSHALLAVGMATFVVPLATLISVFRTDGLSTGIGVWLALLAGAVLVAVALAENRARGAVAT